MSATFEQLFWEADIYITMDERAQDLIEGTKSAPPTPWQDTNQQPDKRQEKRPHEEVHTAGPPAARAHGAHHGGVRTLDEILDYDETSHGIRPTYSCPCSLGTTFEVYCF